MRIRHQMNYRLKLRHKDPANLYINGAVQIDTLAETFESASHTSLKI
jgi:hypothetical protein